MSYQILSFFNSIFSFISFQQLFSLSLSLASSRRTSATNRAIISSPTLDDIILTGFFLGRPRFRWGLDSSSESSISIRFIIIYLLTTLQHKNALQFFIHLPNNIQQDPSLRLYPKNGIFVSHPILTHLFPRIFLLFVPIYHHS